MTSKNGWKVTVTKYARHFEGNTHTLDRTSDPKLFNFLTVLQSQLGQYSMIFSSYYTSESIFWVWLPVSFHLVSCFTIAHRFPSMELHVEHFACSCTKLRKMSKWLMRSFANMRSKARILSPKHLDVLTLMSMSAMNHFLAPMTTTQHNKGGWTMPTILIPRPDASSTQCNTQQFEASWIQRHGDNINSRPKYLWK